MTDDTYAVQLIGDIYVGGAIERREATIYAGETVGPGDGIYVTAGYAYAAKSTDKRFSGVACLNDGAEIDTDYTAGDMIEYYVTGRGTIVWVTLEATSPLVTVLDGDPAAVGTEDGKFREYVYVNATDLTDAPWPMVGRFVIDNYTVTASLTDDKKIKMVMT